MMHRRVFFFSSRRRHTRCSRDWSSDVCSSDLAKVPLRVPVPVARLRSSAPDAFSAHRLVSGTTSADRKSTRLNSSHGYISYAVFCLKKKKTHCSRREPCEVSTVGAVHYSTETP